MQEHGNMNIEAQQDSYATFVKLTTWGTILAAAITVVVVMVIT